MGNLVYGGKRPNVIKYNGATVRTVKYNNVVVWQAIDTYGISGTVFGKGWRTIDDCGQNNCGGGSRDCNCNCRDVYDDYTYKIQLTFTGVYRFPVKYVSKSGATVTINQNQMSGSGTTWTYTSGYLQNGSTNEGYSTNEGINTVKSLYPASGVSGYSSIASINIGAKDESIGECTVDNHNCNCGGGGGDCDNPNQCEHDGQCDCDCYDCSS